MCSTWIATSLIRLGERAGRRADGRVADQDPEAVGVLLDVVEQRAARPARAARAGGRAVSAPVIAVEQRAASRGRRRRRRGLPCRRSARRRPAWRPRRGRRSPRPRCRRSPARRTAPRPIVDELLAPLGAGHPDRPDRAVRRRSLVSTCVRVLPADRSSSRRRRVAGVEPLLDRPAHVVRPSRASRRPRSAGRRCRPGPRVRRAGRRSGRRGAGCATTRPSDRIASHHTLPDLSRLLNGRSPIVWQIELIDQVTWCSSADPDQPAPEERGQRALPRPWTSRPPMTAAGAARRATTTAGSCARS